MHSQGVDASVRRVFGTNCTAVCDDDMLCMYIVHDEKRSVFVTRPKRLQAETVHRFCEEHRRMMANHDTKRGRNLLFVYDFYDLEYTEMGQHIPQCSEVHKEHSHLYRRCLYGTVLVIRSERLRTAIELAFAFTYTPTRPLLFSAPDESVEEDMRSFWSRPKQPRPLQG